MVASFLDVCRYFPAAGGTTDWTYSSAVTGYQSPASAGVVNAATYRYRAESADLTQWEVGTGTYTTATGVLTRTTVLYNSSATGTGTGQSGAGSKINFSAAPQIALVLLAEDLGALAVGQIPGTATNDSANSGNVGEFNTSLGGTTLTSGVVTNITSFSLAAGDWDVWGNMSFTGTGTTTLTQQTAGISTTSATLPTSPDGGYVRCTLPVAAGQADNTYAMAPSRLSLSGTTTVYLIASAIITASTLTATGQLYARRAR